MNKIVNDERMMLRVSRMFYEKNISQSDIAKELNLSRPTVSKLLANAREAGIVTITVSDISGRKYYSLEHELEEVFGLREVLIVDTEDKSSMWSSIGKAAARLLERYIKSDSTVGISLGRSLYQISSNLKGAFLPDTTFIPLVGGLGYIPQEIQGNSLAESLAKKFNGRHIPFYTPARITNENLRNELIAEETVKKVFETSEHMDIALVGIGILEEDSTLLQTGYIDEECAETLLNDDVCGDICMQFFDINGNCDKYKINKEILTIDLDLLKKVDRSIGVTIGKDRTNAIIGAINGGYINTLITDWETAKSLLENKDLYESKRMKKAS